jgi:NAD+ kinase
LPSGAYSRTKEEKQAFIAMFPAPSSPTFAFVASPAPAAQKALKALRARYGSVAPEQASVIVALGGDGFVLETLHRFLQTQKPVYGMNRGSIGFLLNNYMPEHLPERLKAAQTVILHPLTMECEGVDGIANQALAINEVSLLRETRQAAHLRIAVDGVVRLPELVCDGILLSTPAGSTAYNLSVGGPILPLNAGLLALSPISAFRPRRWRGAVLPREVDVTIDILEAEKRPVSAVADYTEVRDVRTVRIRENRTIHITLLFDPEHHLEERIVKEQFVT